MYVYVYICYIVGWGVLSGWGGVFGDGERVFWEDIFWIGNFLEEIFGIGISL